MNVTGNQKIPFISKVPREWTLILKGHSKKLRARSWRTVTKAGDSPEGPLKTL